MYCQVVLWNGWHPVCNVRPDDLATELETYAKQTSSCCQEWQMLHSHPAILFPNLACYTGRSGTRTNRSTCARIYRKLLALDAPLVCSHSKSITPFATPLGRVSSNDSSYLAKLCPFSGLWQSDVLGWAWNGLKKKDDCGLLFCHFSTFKRKFSWSSLESSKVLLALPAWFLMSSLVGWNALLFSFAQEVVNRERNYASSNHFCIFCATKGWSSYLVRVLTGWPLAISVLRLVICSSCRHCSLHIMWRLIWDTLLLILAHSKVRVESEQLHFHMGLTLYPPGALEPETFTLKWPLFEVLGPKLAVENLRICHREWCLSKIYVFSTRHFMPVDPGHLNNRSGIHIVTCLTVL